MKDFWEERFNALATFNAEKARGIMHTEEYKEKMRTMQQEYDQKLRAWNEECGIRGETWERTDAGFSGM